ncbi:hypothetical protein LMG28614_06298 [Paraburkholderia ultramafica]|uniref:DUF4863 domain-containing protein n=1 Tax=Paraburkholderia ultramafica TaxID=1544867 RepID=A0A6S7DGV9_9BURK|nr:DUF4863 family protein [Paraburkholderia ultramafica]CAB3806044.1 hypothetical protein LMG28614_06298 [Paraburkholderia ultramafica]
MLPSGSHKEEMMQVLNRLFNEIRARALDADLETLLNREFGAGSETYGQLTRLLKLGMEEGWAAYVEVEGADYRRGRIAEPSQETAEMSVESGLLHDVKGQYHCHTTGEINMIIPLEEGAQFCGHGAGWRVFPPLSEHFPTVTGKALMMYFLPGGNIEYRTPPAV